MSVSLEAIKERRPGMTDDEAFRDYARECGFHVVVTFLDRSGKQCVKGAIYEEELEELRRSPYVSNVAVVYNNRVLRSQQRESASQAAYAQQRLAEESARHRRSEQTVRGKTDGGDSPKRGFDYVGIVTFFVVHVAAIGLFVALGTDPFDQPLLVYIVLALGAFVVWRKLAEFIRAARPTTLGGDDLR